MNTLEQAGRLSWSTEATKALMQSPTSLQLEPSAHRILQRGPSNWVADKELNISCHNMDIYGK